MKLAFITLIVLLMGSGCHKNNDPSGELTAVEASTTKKVPAATPEGAIRSGDPMHVVIEKLKSWNAHETQLQTYTVYVPNSREKHLSPDQVRERRIAADPYVELPPYTLPNGLLISLKSKDRILTSISQIRIGEIKEDRETIDGFVGVTYDGDWKLIRESNPDG